MHTLPHIQWLRHLGNWIDCCSVNHCWPLTLQAKTRMICVTISANSAHTVIVLKFLPMQYLSVVSKNYSNLTQIIEPFSRKTPFSFGAILFIFIGKQPMTGKFLNIEYEHNPFTVHELARHTSVGSFLHTDILITLRTSPFRIQRDWKHKSFKILGSILATWQHILTSTMVFVFGVLKTCKFFKISKSILSSSKYFFIICTREPITLAARHKLSSFARKLRLWVGIPLNALMSVFILCLCCCV
jgi:hypothetical protein